MLLRPWNYWQKNGEPYPGTTELVAALERVLAVDDKHPGACHFYIHNDAIEANQHAVHADEQYIASEKPGGVYPIAYYPHNHHFLSFAATMAGRSELAIEHARKLGGAVPVEAAAMFNVLEPAIAYPSPIAPGTSRLRKRISAQP